MLQTNGNERGNMLTIERETIAQSKRNHEIKPKKTQQNLQQGGPKTKKAPTSRRDYFKVFKMFQQFCTLCSYDFIFENQFCFTCAKLIKLLM